MYFHKYNYQSFWLISEQTIWNLMNLKVIPTLSKYVLDAKTFTLTITYIICKCLSRREQWFKAIGEALHIIRIKIIISRIDLKFESIKDIVQLFLNTAPPYLQCESDDNIPGTKRLNDDFSFSVNS